jgi:hypothetical protein
MRCIFQPVTIHRSGVRGGADGLGEGLGDGEGEGLGDGEGEGLGDGDGDGLGWSEGVALEKASSEPSRLQAGCRSWAGPEVNPVVSPDASWTKMSYVPSLFDAKAIWLPLGDQLGWMSRAGL